MKWLWEVPGTEYPFSIDIESVSGIIDVRAIDHYLGWITPANSRIFSGDSKFKCFVSVSPNEARMIPSTLSAGEVRLSLQKSSEAKALQEERIKTQVAAEQPDK